MYSTYEYPVWICWLICKLQRHRIMTVQKMLPNCWSLISPGIHYHKISFPDQGRFHWIKGVRFGWLELVSYFLNQNQDRIIPLRPCLESDSPCDQRFLSALYNLTFSFFFSCIESSDLLKDLINNHLLFVIDNNIIDLNPNNYIITSQYEWTNASFRRLSVFKTLNECIFKNIRIQEGYLLVPTISQ